MGRWAFQGTTRDGNGRVIVGATVSVYLSGTSITATIYTEYTGGTAVHSVTSDLSNGSFIFFMDDTEYSNTDMFRVTVSKPGYETQTYDYIDIIGAASSSIVTLSDVQDLSNKTLTTPVLASFYQDAAKTKLMTAPDTASDTLAAIAATQSLTNKTLTTPVIASFYQDAGKTKLMTAPNTASDTLVTLAATQTLSGKTLTTPTIASFANATHTHTSTATGGLVGVVQIKYATIATLITGSTQMPIDNTIPQKTEGDEVVTCAITPLSATNILVIIFSSGGCVNASMGAVALFQDTTAGALAAQTITINGDCPTLVYKMVAGTTSETTFKIRYGEHSAGTHYINVIPGGTGVWGGGVGCSTLTIIECVP
jgi:hypothetical protein